MSRILLALVLVSLFPLSSFGSDVIVRGVGNYKSTGAGSEYTLSIKSAGEGYTMDLDGESSTHCKGKLTISFSDSNSVETNFEPTECKSRIQGEEKSMEMGRITLNPNSGKASVRLFQNEAEEHYGNAAINVELSRS